MLKNLGHEVRLTEMMSGLHIIFQRQGRMIGGVDRRREGVALSD